MLTRKEINKNSLLRYPPLAREVTLLTRKYKPMLSTQVSNGLQLVGNQRTLKNYQNLQKCKNIIQCK